MVWTAIDRVATTIGAPPGVIAAFLGSDPATQMGAARERTDALLAEAAMPEIAVELDSARSTQIDRYQVITLYGIVTERIKAQLSDGLNELAASPADAWTDDLLRTVRALGLSVDARGAVAEEYYAYFATMIELRGAPADEVENLIEARDIYDHALTDLIELGADVPELAPALERLSTDASLLAFRSAIDDLVARSLSGGVPDRSPELTLVIVTENLDGFSAVYRAAAVSSQLTFDLLDATASAVLGASARARASADADIDRAYALALTLTVATLASAALAARYIVRPLRRLRHAAHSMRAPGDRPERGARGDPGDRRRWSAPRTGDTSSACPRDGRPRCRSARRACARRARGSTRARSPDPPERAQQARRVPAASRARDLSRRAHEAPEPNRIARTADPLARPHHALGLTTRCAVHRPRPLQGGERQPRSPGR
jgi:hypothetical protein